MSCAGCQGVPGVLLCIVQLQRQAALQADGGVGAELEHDEEAGLVGGHATEGCQGLGHVAAQAARQVLQVQGRQRRLPALQHALQPRRQLRNIAAPPPQPLPLPASTPLLLGLRVLKSPGSSCGYACSYSARGPEAEKAGAFGGAERQKRLW